MPINHIYELAPRYLAPTQSLYAVNYAIQPILMDDSGMRPNLAFAHPALHAPEQTAPPVSQLCVGGIPVALVEDNLAASQAYAKNPARLDCLPKRREFIRHELEPDVPASRPTHGCVAQLERFSIGNDIHHVLEAVGRVGAN